MQSPKFSSHSLQRHSHRNVGICCVSVLLSWLYVEQLLLLRKFFVKNFQPILQIFGNQSVILSFFDSVNPSNVPSCLIGCLILDMNSGI